MNLMMMMMTISCESNESSDDGWECSGEATTETDSQYYNKKEGKAFPLHSYPMNKFYMTKVKNIHYPFILETYLYHM